MFSSIFPLSPWSSQPNFILLNCSPTKHLFSLKFNFYIVLPKSIIKIATINPIYLQASFCPQINSHLQYLSMLRMLVSHLISIHHHIHHHVHTR